MPAIVAGDGQARGANLLHEEAMELTAVLLLTTEAGMSAERLL
jgi:hypothetical protein